MSIVTEFPTCPQCFQMRIEEWELAFNPAGECTAECENCGATYLAKKLESGYYSNDLIVPGVK